MSRAHVCESTPVKKSIYSKYHLSLVTKKHFQLVDVISMSNFAGYESLNTTLKLVNPGKYYFIESTFFGNVQSHAQTTVL